MDSRTYEHHRKRFVSALDRVTKAHSLPESERRKHSQLLGTLVDEAESARSDAVGMSVHWCQSNCGGTVEEIAKWRVEHGFTA